MKEFLSTVLLAVLTTAVPLLTAHAIRYIQRAGERAQANTDDIKVQGYIKEITDAISDAVEATSQTYVDALKKAGKFDDEAQREAARRALTACIASISPAANAFIKSVYGDFEVYLKNKIEAEVRKQKKAEPATLALPVVESTIPDTQAIAATCAAATAAAVTQVAINQPGTGQAPAPEQQNE